MTADGLRHIEVAARASADGLIDVTAFSEALGRRADLTLFLPRGFGREESLPLVTLLHGVYGSHWAWARSGQAHTTLQSMVDRGMVRPMILAMPSDGLIGVGSGYLNWPAADAQSWILDDVPALTRHLYPRAGENGMAIAGLSMGGWGALRLAARRPNQFRAAAGLSPLTRWEQIASYASPDHRSEHSFPIDDPDLAELIIKRSVLGLPALRISCGSEDSLVEEVRSLHLALESANVVHEYAESAGGHEWSVWENELANTLAFIDHAI